MTPRSLVERIWHRAVESVDSELLVRQAIRCDAKQLIIAGQAIPLSSLRRIEVVGAGKAGAGMASGAELALAQLPVPLTGWVNVPADCVRPLSSIILHPARPAGVNEPTIAGVAGAEEILRRVSALGRGDLCLVLISGGGSALLPAPIEGVSLADKAAVIRTMSLAGAGIDELNCVRRPLSRIKGGGLARACRSEWLITLVISDVIGDPLEVIASGPTIDVAPDPFRALQLINRYSRGQEGTPESVRVALEMQVSSLNETSLSSPLINTQDINRSIRSMSLATTSPGETQRSVAIIANNQTAVDAAAKECHEIELDVEILGTGQSGEAKSVGLDLVNECLVRQRTIHRPLVLLSGGEPVVHVEQRDGAQKGGRNQELVLAALCGMIDTNASGLTILSGGTDGEDGPTDAAGAIADRDVMQAALDQDLSPRQFLVDHNSYPFFQQTGGLLITGPTHTNVMDLRVALVQPLG